MSVLINLLACLLKPTISKLSCRLQRNIQHGPKRNEKLRPSSQWVVNRALALPYLPAAYVCFFTWLMLWQRFRQSGKMGVTKLSSPQYIATSNLCRTALEQLKITLCDYAMEKNIPI